MTETANSDRRVLAIELTLQRYAVAIDTALPDEISKFFTEDARLDITVLPGVRGMSPFSAVGRQEIVDSLVKSRGSFPEVLRTHLVSDLSVTFLGATSASTVSSIAVVVSPEGVLPWRWLTARYVDELVLDGTRWMFTKRHGSIDRVQGGLRKEDWPSE